MMGLVILDIDDDNGANRSFLCVLAHDPTYHVRLCVALFSLHHSGRSPRIGSLKIHTLV